MGRLFKRKPKAPKMPTKIKPPKIKDPFRGIAQARMRLLTTIFGFVAFAMFFVLLFTKGQRLLGLDSRRSSTKTETRIDTSADTGAQGERGASRRSSRSTARSDSESPGGSRTRSDSAVPARRGERTTDLCADVENAPEIRKIIIDRSSPCYLYDRAMSLLKMQDREAEREAYELFQQAVDIETTNEQERICQGHARNFLQARKRRRRR
jgi:hypothetical protein